MSQSRWFRREIEEVAAQYALDPDVVEAVVRVESAGLAHAYRYEPAFFSRYLADDPAYRDRQPYRVSASYGLMQVMFSTAVQHGLPVTSEPEVLFLPVVSLKYGCMHLASLLEWSRGNLDQALAGYNGGKRGNEHPPYRNAGYVSKVRAALHKIKGERG